MTIHQVSLLGVARINKKCVLGCFFGRIPAKSRTECSQHFEKGIESVRPVGFARSKADLHNAVLFLQVDASAELVYGTVISDKKYPDRIAYQMLTEFQNALLMGVGPDRLKNASSRSLERIFSRPARDIIVKYADGSALDPTAQVQKKVENVKVVVDQNIKKMLQNQGNLEELAHRTDTLASTAKQLKQDATEVKSITWKQKMGLAIVLGFLFAVILGYIIYSLADLLAK